MNNKLFVGNLSFSMDEQRLREAFEAHGSVVSATVVNDRDTGRSRGFGFIEYASADEAQHAVDAMNGVDLDGRTLNVNIARPRENRGGGGGGRGGWDRQNDRSSRSKRW